MNIVVIITLLLVLLPLTGLMLNSIYIKWKLRKQSRHKIRLMQPLLQKLDSNKGIGEDEILGLTADPTLRHAVYKILEGYGRQELFPKLYLTRESAAESFLASWLEFPTELGKSPDEIELLDTITIHAEEPLAYYVFKYRTLAPHWAARYDWMVGVCGPYRENSEHYDVPPRVFSRFNEVTKISPAAEAAWVHNNIGRG